MKAPSNHFNKAFFHYFDLLNYNITKIKNLTLIQFILNHLRYNFSFQVISTKKLTNFNCMITNDWATYAPLV